MLSRRAGIFDRDRNHRRAAKRYSAHPIPALHNKQPRGDPGILSKMIKSPAVLEVAARHADPTGCFAERGILVAGSKIPRTIES